ncbi:hypothetical protein O3M35_003592 [Rhynocoris fuscipes]|uniref:Uncharacterized protein n=1 Tax=Rhynocoris fuscipes TaxID=488301 RepID=A0AAW1CNG9_9HEMI
MLLVLIGCGACVNPTASTVQIALAFGFIIASMVQSIGHVSGCHINPAVTLGLFAMGRIGLVKGLIYMVTQCAGALVGAAILKYIVNNGIYVSSLGATQLHPSIDVGQGIAIEAIITSVLVLVVGAVTDPDRKEELGNAAPVAIGLAIACSHLFAVPLTGSGMNPARSLGPAAVASTWENHWVR